MSLFLFALSFVVYGQVQAEPSWRIDSFLAALNDPNEDVQRAAIVWATGKRIHDARVAVRFAGLLVNRSPADRIAVLRAMNSMGTNQFMHIESIARLFDDPDPSVRRQAVVTLGNSRPMAESSTKALVARLADADSDVRRNAIAALTNTTRGPAAFAREIVRLVRDSNKDVRDSAIQALGSMGTNAIPFAPEIVSALNDSDNSVRSHAIEAIGRIEKDMSPHAERFIRLFKDANDQVRLKAVETLVAHVELLSRQVQAEVAGLFYDRNQSVRNKVMALLLTRNGPEAESIKTDFQEAFTNSNPVARENAVQLSQAFGKAGEIFVPAVLKLLHDPDRWVRRNAINALHAFDEGGAAHAKNVAALLNDADEEVRRTAFDVLGKMRGADEAIVNQAILLLNDLSYTNREQMIELLGRTAAEDATALLVSKHLSSTSPSIRRQSASTLAKLGKSGAAYAPQIAELLTDTDVGNRQTGMQVLSTMGPEGAKYASRIATLLSDADRDTRRIAGQTLGSLGEEGGKYAPQVAKLLKDPDRGVRVSAMQALGKMGAAGAQFGSQIVMCVMDLAGPPAEISFNTLEAMGIPLDLKTLLACFEAVHAGRRSDAGQVRVLAYLTSIVTQTNLLLLHWLGHRTDGERPVVTSSDEGRKAMPVICSVWPLLQDYPDTRKEAAEVLASFARTGKWKLSDIPTLTALQRDLQSAGLFSQASEVSEVITRIQLFTRLRQLAFGFAVQVLSWTALLWVYPHSRMIQAIFFWNKWVRHTFGLWYVGYFITLLNWPRRRLFQPFREALVPRRLIIGTDENSYFDQSEAVEEFRGNRHGQPELLLKLLPEVHGQIVLEGQSGVGKTSLLEQLAVKSPRIVVFLKATDCANGVVAAIQKRLHGHAKDAVYLRTLIHAGALDILIDGLNEASPETRSRVSDFFEENFSGNFVLTTQRLSGWNPPANARVFELRPLRVDQIGTFLLRQWPSLRSIARISHEKFQQAVVEYIATISSVESQQMADNRAAILCNPMEARLAAELLAQDEKPNAFRLVQQRYESMASEFTKKNGREFPLGAFAERVYEWRRSDKADIEMEGFALEAIELVHHRLMIQRTDPIQTAQHKTERTRWFFRHDRIMEFILLSAFLGSEHKDRRINHIEDERFWGVYELLAVHLPASDELELYAWLNDWAANTNANELRNRYEIARRRRKSIQTVSMDDENAEKKLIPL
jgi:HEAT repeat protein